jgi:hypothetical protein
MFLCWYRPEVKDYRARQPHAAVVVHGAAQPLCVHCLARGLWSLMLTTLLLRRHQGNCCMRMFSTRPGMHQTPIVDTLWQRRTAAAETDGAVELSARSPASSEQTVGYKFSSDALLREHYINPWGKIRIGRVFEVRSKLAGLLAGWFVGHSPLTVPSLLCRCPPGFGCAGGQRGVRTL